MANNTAGRLLTADHHRMILLMHSEGKTDAEISVWFGEAQHIEISRLAVNRLRRRLQGQAPPAVHTAQSTAAAAAAALASAQADAQGLTLAQLIDRLLRARYAVALQASQSGDNSAAATACRDFIGLVPLAQRFPLESQGAALSTPKEWEDPVVFYCNGKVVDFSKPAPSPAELEARAWEGLR